VGKLHWNALHIWIKQLLSLPAVHEVSQQYSSFIVLGDMGGFIKPYNLGYTNWLTNWVSDKMILTNKDTCYLVEEKFQECLH